MPKGLARSMPAAGQRWSIADGRAIVAAFAASGESATAFARRHGIDVQRLHRWRRQLASGGGAVGATGFVEITPRPVGLVEVVLRSGRVLRVAETIDVAVLVQLAEALEC